MANDFAEFPNSNIVDAKIRDALTSKADKATTLAGYGITDAYTKTEVDTKIVGFVDGAEYDSTTKKILLKHGTTTVAEVDATSFIKDGMVSSVEVVGGNIVITFNTDAGLEPIEIPLTDIFDPDNYYDKDAVDELLDDKQDALTFDNAPTSGSNNPVKSGGIWTAIWGALSALPTGFVSLYDWCVSQLAGKVPTTRTVNGKALSSDVTLSASDVGAATSAQGAKADSAIQRIILGNTATVLSGADIDFPISEPTSDVSLIAAADAFQTWLMMQSYTRLADAMRFSSPVSYYVGDVVFYNDAFYRCTTRHAAGAWNASHFEEVIGGLSTGTPTAPTPTAGDNSTKVATTAFVQGEGANKLDATSAAPAFSTSSTYEVGDHVTYNGKLYRCTTAVTTAGAWTGDTNWTADTMTDPDATLDVTSQNQLRVVAKDGTLLWAQGYDLASSSSATLACDAVNNFTFADGATTQAFTLPTAPTGKAGDFGLDIDNYANTGAATLTLTGLDTTFSVVVPEGESLTDMLAIAAGELARFYVTLTTFRVNNLPTWHIVKQVVENGGAQS